MATAGIGENWIRISTLAAGGDETTPAHYLRCKTVFVKESWSLSLDTAPAGDPIPLNNVVLLREESEPATILGRDDLLEQTTMNLRFTRDGNHAWNISVSGRIETPFWFDDKCCLRKQIFADMRAFNNVICLVFSPGGESFPYDLLVPFAFTAERGLRAPRSGDYRFGRGARLQAPERASDDEILNCVKHQQALTKAQAKTQNERRRERREKGG